MILINTYLSDYKNMLWCAYQQQPYVKMYPNHPKHGANYHANREPLQTGWFSYRYFNGIVSAKVPSDKLTLITKDMNQ